MLFVIAVVAVIAAMNEFKRSGATEKKIGVNQQRVGRGRLFVPHLLLCYRLWALSSALSCGICSSVCVGGAVHAHLPSAHLPFAFFGALRFSLGFFRRLYLYFALCGTHQAEPLLYSVLT